MEKEFFVSKRVLHFQYFYISLLYEKTQRELIRNFYKSNYVNLMSTMNVRSNKL